jgi:hypothetical protein
MKFFAIRRRRSVPELELSKKDEEPHCIIDVRLVGTTIYSVGDPSNKPGLAARGVTRSSIMQMRRLTRLRGLACFSEVGSL